MLKYFDDIIGKGLGMDVIGQLLFYFAIFMTPIAMPLAVLLSSLITFGNLGEHFELTAIKSAGISLVRTLVPIFFFVILLTAFAFYVNNNLVPKAALEAYSLLYDIKQKKPALDLREGTFYDGIPNMNIKVNKKFPDGITLKGIVIYDHRKNDGNKDVTVADSGKMYTIMGERYLKLELYNGFSYTEGSRTEQEMSGRRKSKTTEETLTRTQFSKTQVVFDLSSFELSRTDKKWFQGNRIMRNLSELESDVDSVKIEMLNTTLSHYENTRTFFNYWKLENSISLPQDVAQAKKIRDSVQHVSPAQIESSQVDSVSNNREKVIPADEIRVTKSPAGFGKNADSLDVGIAHKPIRRKPSKKVPETTPVLVDKHKALRKVTAEELVDSIYTQKPAKVIFENAASRARTTKDRIVNTENTLSEYAVDKRVFEIQWHKILANSLACIAMFLIGAPLGAIIKKGGLGVPFLVSILFFIVYYLLTMTGEKWAKQDIVSVQAGIWTADLALFIVGLMFLRQARLDARLFEADFYSVVFDKVKKWLIQKKIISEPVQ